MVHGDLHSGSIMATADDVRIIDPEFVQYGPMGFDIGMLTANYLMAYFSQTAHRDGESLDSYQEWILSVIIDTFNAFNDMFRQLWSTERTGMLYPHALFEDQGHDSLAACNSLLQTIKNDAISVCGIEMHRRCLSLAHNADFETIEGVALRAKLEARNLQMGAELVLRAEELTDASAVTDLARSYNTRDIL
jgi:5-methylthioribose kinase